MHQNTTKTTAEPLIDNKHRCDARCSQRLQRSGNSTVQRPMALNDRDSNQRSDDARAAKHNTTRTPNVTSLFENTRLQTHTRVNVKSLLLGEQSEQRCATLSVSTTMVKQPKSKTSKSREFTINIGSAVRNSYVASSTRYSLRSRHCHARIRVASRCLLRRRQTFTTF